jgi:septum formation protein
MKPEAFHAERILRSGREELILASRSERRSLLLTMLGVSFRQLSPPEDRPSDPPIPAPPEYAMERASAKAQAVAEGLVPPRPAAVLGADTIVILDGEILEKPRDPGEARAHLQRLSGREHTVVTGLALQRTTDGRRVRGYEQSRVRMAALDEATIDLYVRTGEPMDKAGAYGIQGIGALIVESVEGCYFNVVGLPLARLRRLFRELEGVPREGEG